jgi:hypothetical protein
MRPRLKPLELAAQFDQLPKLPSHSISFQRIPISQKIAASKAPAVGRVTSHASENLGGGSDDTSRADPTRFNSANHVFQRQSTQSNRHLNPIAGNCGIFHRDGGGCISTWLFPGVAARHVVNPTMNRHSTSGRRPQQGSAVQLVPLIPSASGFPFLGTGKRARFPSPEARHVSPRNCGYRSIERI